MSTEAITPQSAAEQSVFVAAPVQNQTSAVDEQPSPAASSEVVNAGSSTQNSEASTQLNLDDFESLEDYAQALIEKKQSTLSDEDERPEATGSGEEDHSALNTQHSAASKDEEQKEMPGQFDEEQTGLEIEDEHVFSPRDLNERINSNPELKQALESDPALRNAVFRNARLASEASKYREVFPDVESAQYAAQSAATFRELDDLFLNAA